LLLLHKLKLYHFMILLLIRLLDFLQCVGHVSLERQTQFQSHSGTPTCANRISCHSTTVWEQNCIISMYWIGIHVEYILRFLPARNKIGNERVRERTQIPPPPVPVQRKDWPNYARGTARGTILGKANLDWTGRPYYSYQDWHAMTADQRQRNYDQRMNQSRQSNSCARSATDRNVISTVDTEKQSVIPVETVTIEQPSVISDKSLIQGNGYQLSHKHNKRTGVVRDNQRYIYGKIWIQELQATCQSTGKICMGRAQQLRLTKPQLQYQAVCVCKLGFFYVVSSYSN
jgi:hypothetical protein